MFVHPLESALLVAKSAKHVQCDESAAKKTAEMVRNEEASDGSVFIMCMCVYVVRQ